MFRRLAATRLVSAASRSAQRTVPTPLAVPGYMPRTVGQLESTAEICRDVRSVHAGRGLK